MTNWNRKAKRLLKSELVKRGISNAALAHRLQSMGVKETKSSIDSKISRGTFSAAFLLQCFAVIGCTKVEFLEYTPVPQLSLAAEDSVTYQKPNND